MLWLLIFLALAFAFINGYRDSSTIMAGVISSRALPPRAARWLAAICEFIAPFLFGTAVAKTITTGFVDPMAITLDTVVVAMASALAWTLIAWLRGIPSSSSHALVGGILGAALTMNGARAVIMSGLGTVVLPLFLAPLMGVVVGFMVMQIILYVSRDATPNVNNLFRRLQVFTLTGLSLSHGANDAQKSMGVITLGLLLGGKISSFKIPAAVVALCATAIALGAYRGDWRLMRTLGRKIFLIRPIDSLASQGAAASVVMVSALTGSPVSTSQVISMALFGAGAADRINKVRWQVGGELLVTWVLTVPATMLIAAALGESLKGIEFLMAIYSRTC